MSQIYKPIQSSPPPPGFVETLTGNSGGAVGPDGADNINTVGTGSITVIGNPVTNTLTAELTGLTDHSLLVGAGTATITNLGVATNGQIPIGSAGADPVLANITSMDGTVTITNGAGTIDLSVTNEFVGTATTVGAVTANVITVPLGAVAGAFQFEARVKGFETTGPSAAGYNVYATFRTDGAAATLVGNQDVFNEDAALIAANAYFIASGNDAVLQVLGVAGLTINWSGETEIT